MFEAGLTEKEQLSQDLHAMRELSGWGDSGPGFMEVFIFPVARLLQKGWLFERE